jgi:ribonucleoside-diphosphate reductase alpha chain
VIERHMIDIGFLPGAQEAPAEPAAQVVNLAEDPRPDPGRRQCPKCGAAGLIHQEGCDLCTACGYSKCT